MARILQDMSLEEQDDFWEDIVNSREGRARLLKNKMSQKDIEKIYIVCNDMKVVNTPILNELW